MFSDLVMSGTQGVGSSPCFEGGSRLNAYAAHVEVRGGEKRWRRDRVSAITTAFPAESCSSSFRLLVDSRLRRSRLDIG
jgi:hypothetical protein